MPLRAEFSWLIFFVMAVIFLGSVAVFFVLVRRWTTHSRWTAMSEWARERGFRLFAAGTPLPTPLDEFELVPKLALSSGTTSFIDFTPSMSDAAIHVLHRQLDWPLAPGGLRPAHAHLSFLDRFKLQSFPLITSNERFIAVGADSAAARVIADSMRALLPADLGLLLHGRMLLIDFSSRRFDAIEFDRVLALCDQLVQRLPLPNAVSS